MAEKIKKSETATKKKAVGKETSEKPVKTEKSVKTAKTAKTATVKTVKSGKLPKITVKERKKIIFLGSEAAPFIATGGLADVLGSLPKELAKRDELDISVILPLYGAISEEYRKNFRFLANFNVSVGWRWQYAGVFVYEYKKVKFYFIDNEYYFKREGNIYGFYDDGERFAFFSRAALDTIARLNIYPDVLHCNDWQTAASIVYLKGMYYGDENFRKIKTVFTIHNIEYQGKFPKETFTDLFGFPDTVAPFVEYDGCVNLMKGAIEMTDIVSTVSPSYAGEIKYSFYSHGLDPIIRRNESKLFGILNGIDVDYYDPETDKSIFKNFSASDLSGKARCKAELQKMLMLPERADVPIIAIISRLVTHKGLDLVMETVEKLLAEDVQLIILGKGEIGYENYFKFIADEYKGKCSAIIAYNQDLSRKIYSGSDMFLMPSKSEPCGLSQMIASRYGTVPIVRETGGLNDSIKAYVGESGNGFTFHDYNANDMLYVIKQAISVYNDKKAWRDLVIRVMNTDFSWKKQADDYEKLYNK